MSVEIQKTTAAPIMTTEVPVVACDILRDVRTPAVVPSTSPLESGGVVAVSSSPPASPTIPNAPAVRRMSAGAAIAEAAGIDLNAIGRVEARKIMSVEHKVLGFRPPQGSLAAEAQAAAAKHPQVTGVKAADIEKLKEAAREDAQRILAERNKTDGDNEENNALVINGSVETPGVDLNKISEVDARKLMSHEHRALGFRPPPGSLAAEAQAAAARHPEGVNGSGTQVPSSPKQRRASHSAKASGDGDKSAHGRRKSVPQATVSDDILKEAALRDAEKIKATRGVDGKTASENAHADVSESAPQLGESLTSRASPSSSPGRQNGRSGSQSSGKKGSGAAAKQEDPNIVSQLRTNPQLESTLGLATDCGAHPTVGEPNVTNPDKGLRDTTISTDVQRGRSTETVVESKLPPPASTIELEVLKDKSYPKLEDDDSETDFPATGLPPPLSRSDTADSIQIIGDVLN